MYGGQRADTACSAYDIGGAYQCSLLCGSVPVLPSDGRKGLENPSGNRKKGGEEQENDAGEPEDMPEYSEENDRPIQAETKESQTRSVQEEAVSFWYSERGKKQLDRIVASLYSRGIYECWIRKDGICNFRTDQGYRRAGIFPGYPGANSGLVAKLLRGEGLNATDQGKYLHIVWTEE